MPQESIAVFFPAYNDEHTIGPLVRQAVVTLQELGFADYEVIVINDGSMDGTGAVLAALQQEIPALRVITHPQNRGYGGALRSGIAAATKAVVSDRTGCMEGTSFGVSDRGGESSEGIATPHSLCLSQSRGSSGRPWARTSK